MSQERTEKPTGKRISDARKKGQVPRSHDVVTAAGLLAVSLALGRVGAMSLARMQARLAEGLSHYADAATGTVTPSALNGQVIADLGVLVMVAGPFLLTGAVVAIVANVAQSGWNYAPEKLTPDFNRLNPATGIKRLAPSQSWLDLVKTIIAATLVGTLGYQVIRDALLDGQRLAWMSPVGAAEAGWSRILGLIQQAGFAMLAIAGADYGLQRWRWTNSLKMTKQEVKDEHKMSDGNPEIKGRVRKVQREMTRKRMLSAIKTATVVVTNPTHFAVALEYRRSEMAAPVVVAKGQDHLAQRIKQLAREHGVPMVENVPLARALYAQAEVGQSIPGDLFGAVAEVLAYLVRIRQQTL